ncbi:MAG: deoxyribodipyrimidine photo-lyase [Bryobacterales bacterium]
MSALTIVWFRQDLRLDDNPALLRALERSGPILPLYIWAPDEEGDWPPGGATRWWLHQSLEALAKAIEKRGASLTLRSGQTLETLRAVIAETGADAVHWNRRYEPASIARDAEIKKALESDGVRVKSFNGALLWEPWEALKGNGSRTKSSRPTGKRRSNAAHPIQSPPQ